MKIAVVCANGKAGRLITKEAVERGFDVTAVVRDKNKTATKKSIIKDLFDLTKDDLKNFDAVVDACGAWTPDTLNIIPDAVKKLCSLLKGTDTRLLIVGGAGSLYTDKEHTLTLADSSDFPEAFKPLASVHQNALDYLRKTDGVKWTYISPAADFQAEGEKTGRYIIGGEELTLNKNGESVISYADYASALVDEIETGNHIAKRICAVKE